jgi:hypothetical protein
MQIVSHHTEDETGTRVHAANLRLAGAAPVPRTRAARVKKKMLGCSVSR